MNKLMLISILIGGLFVAFLQNALAGQNDWQKTEHNYNITYKDWGMQLRHHYRDDANHAEFQYNKESIQIALRIAEDTGSVREYQPKLTHNIMTISPFETMEDAGPLSISLGHRIEYRNYETSGTDDYWRYRTIAKVNYNLSDKLKVWAKAQPRWNINKQGESDDLKIDDIKTNVGTDIRLDEKIVFSPYIELMLNGKSNNYSKQSLMMGTALSLKF